jgi:hypothetical protein
MGNEQRKRARKRDQSRKTFDGSAAQAALDRRMADLRQNTLDLDGNNQMRGDLTMQAGDVMLQSGSRAIDWDDVNADFTQKGHGHSCSTEGRGNNWEHSHNISFTPFMKYPRETRDQMLGDRAMLEELLDSESLNSAGKTICKNILNTLRLLMDYKDYDAYERHRRFDDPECAEWVERYKKAYGVDEYFVEDLKFYMEKHGVQMHPHSGITTER